MESEAAVEVEGLSGCKAVAAAASIKCLLPQQQNLVGHSCSLWPLMDTRFAVMSGGLCEERVVLMNINEETEQWRIILFLCCLMDSFENLIIQTFSIYSHYLTYIS